MLKVKLIPQIHSVSNRLSRQHGWVKTGLTIYGDVKDTHGAVAASIHRLVGDFSHADGEGLVDVVCACDGYPTRVVRHRHGPFHRPGSLPWRCRVGRVAGAGVKDWTIVVFGERRANV